MEMVSHIDQFELKCFIRQIFPAYSTAHRAPARNSALARIRERCARMKSSIDRPDAT